MAVAPGFAIVDHFPNVYAIEATDPLSLGRIAWGLRTGEFVSSERVNNRCTREVCAIIDPPHPVNLDGKIICQAPRRFSVAPCALRILAPPRPSSTDDPVFSSLELTTRA